MFNLLGSETFGHGIYLPYVRNTLFCILSVGTDTGIVVKTVIQTVMCKCTD